MSKDKITLLSMVEDDTIKSIKTLHSNMEKGNEFELMIYGFGGKFLSMEKYISLIKFMTHRSKLKKLKTETIDQLDVIYALNDSTNYRINIVEIENINKHVKQMHQYPNHTIFRTFATKILDKDLSLTIQKKIKDKENVVDIADLNIRARLADETSVTKQELVDLKELGHLEMKKITFRMKQRVSYYIIGTEDDDYVRVDLTITRTTKNINHITTQVPNYELEIELGYKNKKMGYEVLFSEAELLLKIIQQSNFIISNKTEEDVRKEYARIAGLDVTKIISLDARQPISLEIQHVTDFLPNRYAVTDKADGDRYFLLIIKNHVYLMSTNLNVRDTGIQLSDKLSKYNDTIMDGEYIFIASKRRHLYMVFDCLYKGGEPVRKIPEFMKRLQHADEVIRECFIFGNQEGFNIKEYVSKGEFDLKDISNFHNKQLTEFMAKLNSDIEKETRFPLIRRKYFIPALGGQPWEIFKYSTLIWNKYSNDSSVNYPYMLDGLIFHPLTQDYITTRDSKLSEYKWKPPEKNSIDFYILFQRDQDTGKIMTVYDNSIADHVDNKPYKICNLYVGQRDKQREKPVLFREKEGGFICNLFLKDDEPVDVDGNLISDNTVVEFYYKNDPELDDRFQWVPLRTRYDKTEAVLRHGRRYGNYIDVANKVWKSIVNPILMRDYEELAKGNDDKSEIYYYDKKINELRDKIGHDIVISTFKENVYFQVITNLAKPMRDFHNWIKSIIIYTHCHPMYQVHHGDRNLENRGLTVLDIACGKGQDIMKFYYAKVKTLIGLDIDREALTSAVDGAISRYKKFKRGKPAFPLMEFIQADAGAMLTFEEQFRALKGMSGDNKKSFERYFSDNRFLFDRVNCQFAIHYFLKNKEVWTNFKKNIRASLKPGGYFLATTFDAESVVNLLNNKEKYTSYYTNQKGEKKMLFELIKKYDVDPSKPMGVGNAIDMFSAWLFLEGNYITEYLVDRRFVEKELLDDCDLELVDTAMFSQVFNMHREYFANYAKYEEVGETRKFLLRTAEYYNDKDEINAACHVITGLNRYYVFRKKDNPKDKQIGGEKTDFTDSKKYRIVDNSERFDSCCHSIAHVMKTHKLIPDKEKSVDFYSNINIEYANDENLTDKLLSKISKNLVIEHEIEKTNDETTDSNGEAKKKIFEKKRILDGINIFVVEPDCNGDYDVTRYGKNNKNRSIILMKNEQGYSNVYKIIDRKRRGLFRKDDPEIVYLNGLL